jgi:predicted nucleic acid-binding protein
MTFLDTSVLVRYVTGDPPEMAERAVEIIEGTEDLSLTNVVLAETAHVLTSYYGMPRAAVVDALIEFVRRENIATHDVGADLVVAALLLWRPSGRVSVPDFLIWAAARAAGGVTVYSFDRRFPSEGTDLRQSR